jgi:hypothetical protein
MFASEGFHCSQKLVMTEKKSLKETKVLKKSYAEKVKLYVLLVKAFYY